MRSVVDGPFITYGNSNPQQLVNPDAGPNIDYQGGAILDPRSVGSAEAAPTAGLVPSFYNAVYVPLLDAVPQALAANRIATSAVGALGAVTLVTAQAAGVSPNLPLVPFGVARNAANVVTVPLTLDFGFCIGGAVGASTAVTLASALSAKFFYPGQRIAISGAGAGGTKPLLTTVVSVAGTALVVADAALTTSATAQIGSLDMGGVTVYPYQKAGAAALFDATQATARAVSVTTTAAGQLGCIATVSGWDIYGMPMTEAITLASAAVANGRKAFKYINTVVMTAGAGAIASGNITVGTTDIIGFNLRADFWEYLNIFTNGAFVSVSTGFTLVDATSPATSTTGDVRGTYALQSASDGTKRTAIFMSIPQYNAVNATNLNPATLTGVTQA